jgi:phage protein D
MVGRGRSSSGGLASNIEFPPRHAAVAVEQGFGDPDVMPVKGVAVHRFGCSTVPGDMNTNDTKRKGDYGADCRI